MSTSGRSVEGATVSGGGGDQAVGRSVERTIEIAASPEAVWNALTQADELTRWFPLEAGVRPGSGGSIRMSWRDRFTSDSAVSVWEPERHLCMEFPQDGLGRLMTDFYLAGRGGATVLRVVTSGFGEGDAWDENYEGVRTGWNFELRGLRHYLERHRGRDRAAAWAHASYPFAVAEAWQRLTGPGGLFGGAGLPVLAEGEPYSLVTSGGATLSGQVEVFEPGRMVVATADGWNDALFRMEVFRFGGVGEATVWLSTYGVSSERVRSLERAWQEALDAVFPTAP